jgi:hypothetical protein
MSFLQFSAIAGVVAYNNHKLKPASHSANSQAGADKSNSQEDLRVQMPLTSTKEAS